MAIQDRLLVLVHNRPLSALIVPALYHSIIAVIFYLLRLILSRFDHVLSMFVCSGLDCLQATDESDDWLLEQNVLNGSSKLRWPRWRHVGPKSPGRDCCRKLEERFDLQNLSDRKSSKQHEELRLQRIHSPSLTMNNNSGAPAVWMNPPTLTLPVAWNNLNDKWNQWNQYESNAT